MGLIKGDTRSLDSSLYNALMPLSPRLSPDRWSLESQLPAKVPALRVVEIEETEDLCMYAYLFRHVYIHIGFRVEGLGVKV